MATSYRFDPDQRHQKISTLEFGCLFFCVTLIGVAQPTCKASSVRKLTSNLAKANACVCVYSSNYAILQDIFLSTHSIYMRHSFARRSAAHNKTYKVRHSATDLQSKLGAKLTSNLAKVQNLFCKFFNNYP